MTNRFSAIFLSIIFISIYIHSSDVFPAENTPRELIAIALRNWQPQYDIDKKTGEPVGFAIDIMDKVAQQSGLKVCYAVYDTWPDAFEALRNNQADLAPNMGMTDERLGLYDFTTPYETFRISIFVRKNSVDINAVNDLDNRKIGVVRSNQGLALMKNQGHSDLQIFDSMEEVFMALISGDIDALVYPEPVIINLARRSGLKDNIKIIGRPLQEIKRGIALPKGNPELFQKLDFAVRQLIKTRDYQLIYEKWYGRPDPFWNVTRVIVWMSIVLGLAIAGLSVWRYVSILKLNRSLSEAEERFRGIVENTTAGYFFIDKEGKFQRVNRAWAKMHGYDSPDDIIGQPFTQTQVKTDLKKAQQNVETLLSGHSIPTGELSRCYKDGSVGYHTFSAHPVVQGGQVAGFEGFIIDTTDQRHAEKEKELLETRLWQLRKAESLGRMAGAIAHHFNNHLSVILGNLELALENIPGDAVTREFMIESMMAAHRLSEVSGLMLTCLGQGTGKPEDLDLSEVCRQNLSLLQDALPECITLETDFMAKGPIIEANANQVRQILTHLIANGVEAIGSHNGKIKLATRTMPASDIPKNHISPIDWKPDADHYACLEVTDTGCGISQQDMNKIFDPFFTNKFTGRGLGLAVVLGTIKAWKGVISVETRKEHGSAFRIYLPLVSDKIPQPSEMTTMSEKIKDGSTVLLVEDQDLVRKMAEKMIARLGFSVLSASDGTQALELFRQHQDMIRCVITDLTMPGMDGWEILRILRKIQPALPVILASGYEEAQAMDRDDSEKPHAFLHKPYSKDELKKVLYSAMEIEI
ncbi:MAG: transporter substrate-binding domain-containing protein [Proteobacteria bacterium]|nr:transporter substrate-binding domain-containing protein [Pseudomonadota bacterium]MBU1584703.1 transporter substrate-binding domain-containing protein [Pseudomonadota bacterium]MBU2627850.1 transporter substrate-binding domain-containing protein [Pseudomonadota bacterium]